MDERTIKNRLVQTAMASAGAAALTATLLLLFQDQVKPPSATQARPAAPSSDVPKLGKGEDMLADYIGTLNKFAAKAKATKQKVGYIDNFGTKIYIVSEPEHVRVLFSRISAHALWGGIKPASEAFFGKSVLFVLEGEDWKKLRSLLRSAITTQKVSLMQTDVASCAVDLSNRLEAFADAGRVVDMNAAFAAYHLACVGKSTFNYGLDTLSSFPEMNEISSSFEYMLAELPRRSFHPDAKVQNDYVSPTDDNLKWQKASKTVRAVVTRAITKRLEDEKRQDWMPRGDLLDTMIAQYRQAFKEAGRSTAKDAELITDAMGDNLVEMFFAGYNTSVVAMCSALYYVAKDPVLAERVQREVDEQIPVDILAGSGLAAKSFPLLTRVFQESMRLVPPAPLAARLMTEDLDLGNGVVLPNGANVWFPAYFVHTDKSVWGPDADKFDPDRFLKTVVPGSYIPFNLGIRDCIGKIFAELESVVALAVLFKTYSFQLAPGYEFTPLFTGFGFRPFDANDKTVSMKLIPHRRVDTSVYQADWTPSKMPRRSSHSLLRGLDLDNSMLDELPPAPKRF